MSVGQYRHLVTLTGPSGAPVFNGESWVYPYGPLDPPTWYCAIDPATARDLEFITAGTTQTATSHILEGHYHAGINTQTQIGFQGRTFYVAGVVNPEERNLTTIALCHETGA